MHSFMNAFVSFVHFSHPFYSSSSPPITPSLLISAPYHSLSINRPSLPSTLSHYPSLLLRSPLFLSPHYPSLSVSHPYSSLLSFPFSSIPHTGDADEAPEGFVWKGRGKKTFLYDIVANKRNGVDVDRFDYFRRYGPSLSLSFSPFLPSYLPPSSLYCFFTV